ncbi:MAG: hypothetical protein J7L96_02435, partial [Bacteroidales bacterium]|nr:hypothetical protein [Bacteroidales bacterium]
FNDDVYPILPDDYFSFMDSVEIPDTFDDLGKSSYYFLNSYLRKKYKLAGSENSGFNDFYSFAKSQLPDRLGYVFYAYSLSRDFRKELYDAFGDDCSYPDIAALVKEKYQHLEGMLAGNQAPDFLLPDVNGELTGLSDLKGKRQPQMEEFRDR